MSKAKAQANTLTSHQVTKVFNRIRLMSKLVYIEITPKQLEKAAELAL